MGQSSSRRERTIEGKARAIHYLQDGVEKTKSIAIFNSKGEIVPLDSSPGSPRECAGERSPAQAASFLPSSLTKTPAPVQQINIIKAKGYFSTPASKRPSPTPSKLPSPKRTSAKPPAQHRHILLAKVNAKDEIAEEVEFTDDSNRDGPFLTADKRGRAHNIRTVKRESSFKLLRRKGHPAKVSVSETNSLLVTPHEHSEQMKGVRSSASVIRVGQKEKLSASYSAESGLAFMRKATIAGKYIIKPKRRISASIAPPKAKPKPRAPGSIAEYQWRWRGENGRKDS